MAEKSLKTKDLKPKTTKVKTTRHSLKADDKVKSSLTADVYDLTGKIVDSIELSRDVFGGKVNKKLIAQAVRVYLANQRTGSASTKTRGEVRGSTRKIYRQKGTGRARHGGVRAPIFVHGGIAHGPKVRDFSLQLPQKMKKAALNSILSVKAKENGLMVLSGFDKAEGKTKQISNFLQKVDLINKKVLIVLDKRHENLIKAVRNIKGVTYEFVNQLHVYEIMRNQRILFMKDSLKVLEDSLTKIKLKNNE